MEKLKIAIADKILEASASESEMMRAKLRKIQRFSDFSEALKSMMQKYPEIEEELLRMVNDDNFDTAKASRRVDYILDKEYSAISDNVVTNNIVLEEQTKMAVLPNNENVSNGEPKEFFETNNLSNEGEETTDSSYSIETESESSEEEIEYTILGKKESDDEDELKRAKNKKIVLTVLKIILIVGIIVALYFIVKNYWKYILLAAGIALVVFVGWKYYRHKKQNE